MTIPHPFPEHLDPPEQAGECAVCGITTEDGRMIHICSEDVDALADAGRSARMELGPQWICERCADRIDETREDARVDAYEHMVHTLRWDAETYHPMELVRRLIAQATTATKAVTLPVLYAPDGHATCQVMDRTCPLLRPDGYAGKCGWDGSSIRRRDSGAGAMIPSDRCPIHGGGK